MARAEDDRRFETPKGMRRPAFRAGGDNDRFGRFTEWVARGMGTPGFLVGLSVFAIVFLTLSWATPVAALIAGAVGAVVSVVQRINSGKFELATDVGGYPCFLGGLRPLIGGAFAMVISFAFTGGLLHLPVDAGESTDNRRLALLVLGFVAGFSERWAQDTLTAIVPESKPAPEQPSGR